MWLWRSIVTESFRSCCSTHHRSVTPARGGGRQQDPLCECMVRRRADEIGGRGIAHRSAFLREPRGTRRRISSPASPAHPDDSAWRTCWFGGPVVDCRNAELYRCGLAVTGAVAGKVRNSASLSSVGQAVAASGNEAIHRGDHTVQIGLRQPPAGGLAGTRHPGVTGNGQPQHRLRRLAGDQERRAIAG